MWGSITERGVDESHAVGMRLGRWLREREVSPRHLAARPEASPGVTHSEAPGGDPEDAPGDSRDGQVASSAAMPVATEGFFVPSVLAPSNARSLFTARAVLDGLVDEGLVDESGSVPIDTSAGDRLRVRRGAAVEPSSHSETPEDLAMREEVEVELLEALHVDEASLGGADWPRLLDVAECSTLFGLLPEGALPKPAWRALLGAPQRSALEVMARDSTIGGGFGRMLRVSLTGSIRAANNSEHPERLRICVMPGFSMLCWAMAIGLDGASAWPAPCANVLVETLRDEAGVAYIRFWNLRDMWELRPSWHREPGPPLLADVLKVLQDKSWEVTFPSTASREDLEGPDPDFARAG